MTIPVQALIPSWRYKLPTVPLTAELNVKSDLSPKDGMFKEGLEEHYRFVGRSALETVRMAMLATGKTAFQNILDLPCGHGRVMRALKAAFPNAKLTACDLDRRGVDFCAENFGALPDYSAPSADQIKLEGGYDLIWCGSLLTHLNAEDCRAFLAIFQNLLDPDGVMIVTTCGRRVVNRFEAGTHTYGLGEDSIPALLDSYKCSGFGYADYPKQRGYGISVCSPGWLMAEIAKLPDVSVAAFSEHFWAQHQDVTACVRSATV